MEHCRRYGVASNHGGCRRAGDQLAAEQQRRAPGARTGSRYQLDFQAYIARGPTSSQSFFIILRGEGADFNGDDYLAYRTDRATNSSALFYFDAVGPGTAAF